ncbi:hypothetical protein BJ741DRAFT_588029 [Chytriomyces cf. hyalinus JEL632]|nr:hypothetical protein BJ741DRAFT_588029 [Chytriomyces cf. hyalinus JEL632]
MFVIMRSVFPNEQNGKKVKSCLESEKSSHESSAHRDGSLNSTSSKQLSSLGGSSLRNDWHVRSSVSLDSTASGSWVDRLAQVSKAARLASGWDVRVGAVLGARDDKQLVVAAVGVNESGNVGKVLAQAGLDVGSGSTLFLGSVELEGILGLVPVGNALVGSQSLDSGIRDRHVTADLLEAVVTVKEGTCATTDSDGGSGRDGNGSEGKDLGDHLWIG